MRDLILAFGLLFAGVIALNIRATRAPYDYRAELKADPAQADSLAAAMEKALEKKNAKRDPTSVAPKNVK